MNIWRFKWFVLKFLWEVGIRQSKNCSPGNNCFRLTVLPGGANYFLIKTSDTLMINPVIQKKKLNNQKKKLRYSLFWEGQKKLNHQKQPPRCSVKKGIPRNFAKFTGKHLCQRLFFNKVTGLWTATLLKRSLWYRCYSMNFAKFQRTSFSQNTSGRVLLNHTSLLKKKKTSNVK